MFFEFDRMPGIVYSRHYNIGFFGLERLHPFDARKYGRAWRLLRRHFGTTLSEIHLRPRRPVTREELLLVHSGDYLCRLSEPSYVAGALCVPAVRHLPGWAIDRYVLRPMRWATEGTVVAASTALKRGFAVNLSGGYHHAKRHHGEGFCIYADAAVAVASLRKRRLIDDDCRIVSIDTDAHQGNGVCDVFRSDTSVFLFDIFNSRIYPMADVEARRRIDCSIPVNSSTTDADYLGALHQQLPEFLDSVGRSPIGLAIYNAGTDVFAGDPLGRLNISAETILERDLFVVRELRKRDIPTIMLLSGGYTRQSYQLVAESVIRLIEMEMSAGR